MDTTSTLLRLTNRSIRCVEEIALQLVLQDYSTDLMVMREILKDAHEKILLHCDMESVCCYELENSKGHWQESISLKDTNHQTNLIHLSIHNAEASMILPVNKAVGMRRTLHRLQDYLGDTDYCHPVFTTFMERVLQTAMIVMKDTHQFNVSVDVNGVMMFTANAYDGKSGFHATTRSMANVVMCDYDSLVQMKEMGYQFQEPPARSH